MLPQLYGYIRYSLLHEGAHIHTSNVDHANELITGYVLSSLTDHEVMTAYAQAVSASFTNVIDIYQHFFDTNAAAQRLQAEEAHRVEHETDVMMVAHTDCEQCMHEYIRFVSGVNQQRISEGYVGLHELTQRAHELAGKRCKWHAKQK
jgi:hypothetical protein